MRTVSCPTLRNAIAIQQAATASIIAEVAQHIGDNVVRCIAMNSHRWPGARHGRRRYRRAPSACRWARSAWAAFSTFWASPSIDSPRLQGDGTLAHPPSRALVLRISRAATEILETGIKVVDLICPYAKGGKIGLFGGAGVGKTVLIMELINNVAKRARRPVGIRRRWRAHP